MSTATIDDINIDKTAPGITATGTATKNPAGWYHTPPTIHFTCTDALSGIATCPADTPVSSDGTNQTVTGTATDKACNSASTVTGLNIDLTAPVVTVAGAVNGTTYPLNQIPTPSCSTTDATSGLATPATLTTSRTARGARPRSSRVCSTSSSTSPRSPLSRSTTRCCTTPTTCSAPTAGWPRWTVLCGQPVGLIAVRHQAAGHPPGTLI